MLRASRNRLTYVLVVPLAWVCGCTSDDTKNAAFCDAGCTIEIQGIALLTDSADQGMFQSERQEFARDSRGNFVTGTPTGIVVFDSIGNIVTSMGRQGQGPGEFRFAAPPLVRTGAISVYDIMLRKLVTYGDDYVYRGETPFPFQPTLTIDGDSLATTVPFKSPEHFGFFVHVLDSVGGIARSLGSDTGATRTDRTSRNFRLAALDPTGDVWVAHNATYRFQLWSRVTGELMMQVAPEQKHFDQTTELLDDPAVTRPSGWLTGIYADSSGLLWVLSRVADSKWRQQSTEPRDRPYSADEEAAMFDWHLAAIDPKSNRIVAESRFDKPIWLDINGHVLYTFAGVRRGALVFEAWRANLHPSGSER